MIQQLASQLNEMEAMLPMAPTENKSISNASVGWHIAHNVVIINQVIAAIASADPALYKPRFTLVKWVVFFTKKIPRGRVQAPKYVDPSPDVDLNEALERASISLLNLMNVAPQHYFTHPIFGDLDRAQTIKFLWIHTEHHLKIARDILK